MLLVFLEASFSHDVKAQGNVFNPGKYNFAGSLNVLPNGNVNLRLRAKKEGAGPSSRPPSFEPAPTASGFTTGTFNTGAGPTTGISTSPGNRNAGIGT
ncbi:hypothetical protein OS493_005259 [Desmophyllum pertusum]|uniref:Uncharacterized protein n=1 Tax=Desmophyllum pertusum TaxID=174260 RepID=A0A9W9Z6U2_9CNID|nr:hypothetical protein OS493_005259 [Desmophyllum pertusum]